MKTLLLMRHAKSSWRNPSLEDHDRPLSGRGKRDAPRMGALLRRQGVVLDGVISSTARRARKTAKRIAKAQATSPELWRSRELYEASPARLVAVARTAKAPWQTLMLVGHNPAMEQLVEQLAGQHHRFPTAAIALFTLPALASWSQLTDDGPATLEHLWLPRELGGLGR